MNGSGWISDDSSFYGRHGTPKANAHLATALTDTSIGSDEEKQRLTELVGDIDASRFWRAHAKDINVIMMAARTQLLVKTTGIGIAKPPSSSDHDDASKSNRSKAGNSSTIREQASTMSGLNPKAVGQEDIAISGKRKREPSPGLELFNPLQGRPDAWQLGESVDEFVRRLPPVTTSVFTCPWIWAENPHRNPRDKSSCPRVGDFTTHGMKLLEQSLDNRREIQKASASQPKGMMTRQLNQESKSLQERIAILAKDTNVISGKVV